MVKIYFYFFVLLLFIVPCLTSLIRERGIHLHVSNILCLSVCEMSSITIKFFPRFMFFLESQLPSIRHYLV